MLTYYYEAVCAKTLDTKTVKRVFFLATRSQNQDLPVQFLPLTSTLIMSLTSRVQILARLQ